MPDETKITNSATGSTNVLQTDKEAHMYIYGDPELAEKVHGLEISIAVLQQKQGTETVVAGLLSELQALQQQIQALQQPRKTEPEPSRESQDLQEIYLKRVRDEVSQLSLLIHIDPTAAERHMELAKIYTALLTLGGDEREMERMMKQGREEKPKPVSALEQLNRHKHLVLIGAPGSGKSTFVDFVVMCMAGELLNDEQKNLQLLQTPLPKEADEKEEPKPQPWGHGALLPVKIELRRFVAEGLPAVGQPVSSEQVWAYLTKQLEPVGLAEYVPILKKQFYQSGGLFLFDGLDEIADPDNRAPQLKAVLEDLARCYDKCHIIVTSRPYAYQNPKWQLQGFNQTTLANFSEGQIKQFIQGWCAYLGYFYKWNPETRQERANQLEQAIFSHHREMRSLAEKPLLLTLMVNLHASTGSLPNKRAELYEETVKLLLERWERGRSLITPRLVDYLEASLESIRKLLHDLAFDAHANQPAKVADTANLDELRLLRGLIQLTAKKINSEELLSYLDQRAGILESMGQGIYRFPHRTFQEYLAACHLTDRDAFAADTAELVRADTNRWREVALLAGAKASSGMAGAVWLLVDELCVEEWHEGLDGSADFMAALLAGQAILETVNLSQLGKAGENKIKRVCSWLEQIAESDLPPRERVLAGQVLSKLADVRLGVGTSEANKC